ncbi:type II toxin-antitoxin system HicB family antitoxin, partial [Patescibacteria group bacterium]|nr:type II toxin-antitoxin system HicB family antitoxin [Patescibacteria group bacterium]
MLSEFIAKNLKKARYKILDDNTYFGEIPGLDGVWANAKNLEDCRAELQDVLEGWQVVLPGSGPE